MSIKQCRSNLLKHSSIMVTLICIKYSIKALKKVDFDEVIIIDHVPMMVYPNTANAHQIGYLQALVERAMAEG